MRGTNLLKVLEMIAPSTSKKTTHLYFKQKDKAIETSVKYYGFNYCNG